MREYFEYTIRHIRLTYIDICKFWGIPGSREEA